jgi:hypothetical protein
VTGQLGRAGVTSRRRGLGIGICCASAVVSGVGGIRRSVGRCVRRGGWAAEVFE